MLQHTVDCIDTFLESRSNVGRIVVKQLLKLPSCLLSAVLMVSGCNSKGNDKDLFNYKGSHVGDTSAVGNILNKLPFTGYSKDFELQTGEKPYGVILNYDDSESETERKEIIVYTATYLFILVQNVDWIKYNFDGQEYQVNKQELQNWYGQDLNKEMSTFKNQDELNVLIDKQLNDEEKVKQLLYNSKK